MKVPQSFLILLCVPNRVRMMTYQFTLRLSHLIFQWTDDLQLHMSTLGNHDRLLTSLQTHVVHHPLHHRIQSCQKKNTTLHIPIVFCKGKHLYLFHFLLASFDHMFPPTYSFISSLDAILLPRTVHEALQHPSWHEEMVEEIMPLDQNSTWSSGDLPMEKKDTAAVKVNGI